MGGFACISWRDSRLGRCHCQFCRSLQWDVILNKWIKLEKLPDLRVLLDYFAPQKMAKNSQTHLNSECAAPPGQYPEEISLNRQFFGHIGSGIQISEWLLLIFQALHINKLQNFPNVFQSYKGTKK